MTMPLQAAQNPEPGQMSGSMMEGMSQRMSGTIVDLLSYVTRRSSNQSNGNAGGNGGGSNNKGAQLPRPLGLVSNDQIYLIEITPRSGAHNGGSASSGGSNNGNGNGNAGGNGGNDEKRIENRLSNDIGKTVNVMGRVYRRGGVEVLVVESVM
ncbi:MAG: hypothetical protein GIX03_12325 [Candidatus Eremiobacteraeota bacterium]|nr:hypothetical protein [Candidatus Eremiobacteraeota bacterium]MBC5803750.1 hypothetical protein [Candidatus Eremiobacteraeota bacterium]MBC5823000.1 hypothetical protein [Candidatus Eremiobacteraeota bacterium]